MYLADLKRDASDNKTSVDLVALWREHDTQRENVLNGLVKLAMRILSIVANLASTERILSQFEVMHTRHRNRMDHEKTRKITLVKADVEATVNNRRSQTYPSFFGVPSPSVPAPAADTSLDNQEHLDDAVPSFTEILADIEADAAGDDREAGPTNRDIPTSLSVQHEGIKEAGKTVPSDN
ncbi:hypothetical protein NMY22_g13202 [Coprinellus aureogranulatus]|nr:hypothetical protein NMY22_g13202 [Coprinellus aureogranulatus]